MYGKTHSDETKAAISERIKEHYKNNVHPSKGKGFAFAQHAPRVR